MDMRDFDARTWESAINNINASQEPTLFLGLEENIIEAMAYKAAQDSAEEISRIEHIILNHKVDSTPLTHPFLKATREAVQGAAETLRNLKKPAPAESSAELIAKARKEPNQRKKLEIAGKVGLRIIHGDPAEIAYTIPDGTLKNWVIGAKTAKNIILRNSLRG
jgi:hypothetical protein